MINKKKFKFKIGKTFKDKRGWLKKILDGNFSSCIEVYSKKGSVRANHYHKKDKHFIYIISGEILYFRRDIKKNAKSKVALMKKNDLFFTPTMQEHMAYFTKNTHFLAFSTRKRTKFDYEKDLIRVNMEKYDEVKKAIFKYKKF
jgi:oxalate decarboxylase/phosphoglucose isomerase-like protein (cupin superfamily)|tara:strand:- start:153 stop:584 length:432 start_codon:yes stop_codon:yes gene_type:complete